MRLHHLLVLSAAFGAGCQLFRPAIVGDWNLTKVDVEDFSGLEDEEGTLEASGDGEVDFDAEFSQDKYTKGNFEINLSGEWVSSGGGEFELEMDGDFEFPGNYAVDIEGVLDCTAAGGELECEGDFEDDDGDEVKVEAEFERD